MSIEKPPFFMHAQTVCKSIHVNFFSAQVDPVYFPQTEVIGDIANSIWQMKEFNWSRNPIGTFRVLREGSRRRRSSLSGHGTEDDRFPIYPQRLVADVRRGYRGQGNHRLGQRRLQDLVCTQLQSSFAQHGAP